MKGALVAREIDIVRAGQVMGIAGQGHVADAVIACLVPALGQADGENPDDEQYGAAQHAAWAEYGFAWGQQEQAGGGCREADGVA